ncbi:MAG TPA: hypothetical protein VKR06_31895 [Ktedonosporobacter sp.]|nr:hypothetical protein [Ktedonosporobacter sp.]
MADLRAVFLTSAVLVVQCRFKEADLRGVQLKGIGLIENTDFHAPGQAG